MFPWNARENPFINKLQSYSGNKQSYQQYNQNQSQLLVEKDNQNQQQDVKLNQVKHDNKLENEIRTKIITQNLLDPHVSYNDREQQTDSISSMNPKIDEYTQVDKKMINTTIQQRLRTNDQAVEVRTPDILDSITDNKSNYFQQNNKLHMSNKSSVNLSNKNYQNDNYKEFPRNSLIIAESPQTIYQLRKQQQLQIQKDLQQQMQEKQIQKKNMKEQNKQTDYQYLQQYQQNNPFDKNQQQRHEYYSEHLRVASRQKSRESMHSLIVNSSVNENQIPRAPPSQNNDNSQQQYRVKSTQNQQNLEQQNTQQQLEESNNNYKQQQQLNSLSRNQETANSNQYYYQNNRFNNNQQQVLTTQSIQYPNLISNQKQFSPQDLQYVSQYDSVYNLKPRNEKSKKLQEEYQIKMQLQQKIEEFKRQQQQQLLQQQQQQAMYMQQQQLANKQYQEELLFKQQQQQQQQSQIQQELERQRQLYQQGLDTLAPIQQERRVFSQDKQPEKQIVQENQQKEEEEQQPEVSQEDLLQEEEKKQLQQMQEELNQEKREVLLKRDIYKELIQGIHGNMVELKDEILDSQNQLGSVMLNIQQENIRAQEERDRVKREIKNLQQSIKINEIAEQYRREELTKALKKNQPINLNLKNPLEMEKDYTKMIPELNNVVYFKDFTVGLDYKQPYNLYHKTQLMPTYGESNMVQDRLFKNSVGLQEKEIPPDLQYTNPVTQAIQLDKNIDLDLQYGEQEEQNYLSEYQPNQDKLDIDTLATKNVYRLENLNHLEKQSGINLSPVDELTNALDMKELY